MALLTTTGVPNAFSLGTTDTPLDSRSRVDTEADIINISNAYIGLIVYVLDTDRYFKITKLKDKKTGMTVTKNAAVAEYVPFTLDNIADSHEHENKDILDSITLTDISNWNAKSDFSGSYLDLSDTPDIPTKISDLTDDLSLATQLFVTDAIANIDLSALASIDYVDEQISTHEHTVIEIDEIEEEIENL